MEIYILPMYSPKSPSISIIIPPINTSTDMSALKPVTKSGGLMNIFFIIV